MDRVTNDAAPNRRPHSEPAAASEPRPSPLDTRGTGASPAPRVSVVLPTYRRPEYLDRAIATVRAQTLSDWELIVVDDNDPMDPDRDRTQGRLAAHLVDPRVRTLLHASNRGGGAARNTGIRAARGEWIAFLDDDDEWDRTKLERQLAAADAATADVGLVYCRIRAVRASTGRVSVYRSEPLKCTKRDLLVRNHIGGTSCIMVRADALHAVGMFDESLASRQDIDLYVRLVETYRFVFVDAPLVTMHLHAAPRISTSASAKVRGHREFLEKHRDVIEANAEALRARLNELGRYLLDAGELREARRALVRAWSLEVRDSVAFKRMLMTFPTLRSLNQKLRLGRPEARGRDARGTAPAAPARVRDPWSTLHGHE